jgi:Na+-driven multidrug efflux pump
MSTASRVLKNTGFLYVKMGITIFLSLYTTRLILNALGAFDFGIFTIVGGAIAMLGFLNTAMAGATQRFMSYSEGEGNINKKIKIFNISILLHLMISILMVIILVVMGYFYFNGLLKIPSEREFAAKIVYLSLIVSTGFTVMTVPYDAILNSHENMLYYSIVGIIESLLKLSVALLIVSYGGDKLLLYGILMACIPLVTMSIMRLYCHRKYKECVIGIVRYFDKSLFKEMLTFNGWSLMISTTSMLGFYGQGIIINQFFSTVVNAAQGIASQMSGQLSAFSNTMLKALNPFIVKSEGAGNRNLMIRATILGTKFSFYLLSLFAIPVIIEMPFILKVWIKNVPDYTILFCRLELIRALLSQLYLVLNTAISANGNISRYSKYMSIINILPMPIMWYVFHYGGEAFYIYIVTTLFWVVIGGGISIFFFNKNTGASISLYFYQVIFKCIFISISVSVIDMFSSYVLSEGFFRFIFIFFIHFSTLVLFIYKWGLEKSELYQIKQPVIMYYKKIKKI